MNRRYWSLFSFVVCWWAVCFGEISDTCGAAGYLMDAAGYLNGTAYGDDVSLTAEGEIGCFPTPAVRSALAFDVHVAFGKAFVSQNAVFSLQYIVRFGDVMFPLGAAAGTQRIRVGSYTDYIGLLGFRNALYLSVAPQVSVRLTIQSLCVFDTRTIWTHTLFLGLGYSFWER